MMSEKKERQRDKDKDVQWETRMRDWSTMIWIKLPLIGSGIWTHDIQLDECLGMWCGLNGGNMSLEMSFERS